MTPEQYLKKTRIPLIAIRKKGVIYIHLDGVKALLEDYKNQLSIEDAKSSLDVPYNCYVCGRVRNKKPCIVCGTK
jgi:hypothetical protein